MRLLQVEVGDGRVIDLHPYVSVVSGVDDRARRALLGTVSSLGAAEVPSAGLVEAHGVMLDLDEATLRMLDLGAVDADPVVSADELPASGLHPTERERRAVQLGLSELAARLDDARRQAAAAADAVRTLQADVQGLGAARQEAEEAIGRRRSDAEACRRQIDELSERREEAQAEVDAARPAARTAAEERRAAESQAAGPRNEAANASARVAELRNRLAAVEEQRDPGAAAELDAAIAELQTLEEERAARLAELEQQDALPPEVRLERAERRRTELRDLIAALEPLDVSAVADAHHRLTHLDEAPKVPSTEAMELASRLDAVADRLRALEDPDRDADPRAARRRLDDAHQALLDAELEVRGPAPDSEAIEAVEAAHAELLDAVEAAEGRLAGPRTQKRLERAREAEREALEALGFSSYTDYRTGARDEPVSEEQQDRLDAALRELAEAEEALRLVRSSAEVELERATALDEQRRLLAAARQLLGARVEAGDAADALRAHRVPVTPPETVAAELRNALDGVGFGLDGEDLEVDDLVLLAEACMDEVDRSAERRRNAVEELDGLETQVTWLREEVARAEAEAAARREAGEIDPLDAARARTEEARSRVARDAEAAAESQLLQAELRDAEQAEQATAAALAESERRLAEASAADEAAEATRQQAEADLAEVLSSLGELTQRLQQLEEAASADDVARLSAELAEKDAQLAAARSDLERAEAVVRDVEAEQAALQAELHSLSAGEPPGEDGARILDPLRAPARDDDPGTDDIEWYLLARLAAQRAVSYAGSLPIVLDDALRGLHAVEVGKVLARLERMAETVQVIVVSDSRAVLDWASSVGPERAAVVGAEEPAEV